MYQPRYERELNWCESRKEYQRGGVKSKARKMTGLDSKGPVEDYRAFGENNQS